MKVVVASGYFDPIHVGHIEYLEKASLLGTRLIVIVNSDNQAKIKKGSSFMSEGDRVKIISSLRCVDEVFLSVDVDGSVCESLRVLSPDIFAKGGYRMISEIPESQVCLELGIDIVDSLGEKIRSSSSFTGIVQKENT